MDARLVSLALAQGKGPRATVILPTARNMPAKGQNVVLLRDLLKKITTQLQNVSKAQADSLSARVAELAGCIDMETISVDGYALCVDETTSELIPLYGPCAAYAVVGSVFALSEVVASLQRPHRAWVLVLSHTIARLFLYTPNVTEELVTPLTDEAGNSLQGFPLDIVPPADKDRASYGHGDRGDMYKKDKVQKFFYMVDDELHKVLRYHEKLPVVVCALAEELAQFDEATKHRDAIQIKIPHDFSSRPVSDIHEATRRALEEYVHVIVSRHMQAFTEAASVRRQACGPHQVWESVVAGRVQLALIEEDYHAIGRVDPDNMYHLQQFTEQNEYTADRIADLIVQQTIAHKGEVCMVAAGSLAGCSGVGALLRF